MTSGSLKSKIERTTAAMDYCSLQESELPDGLMTVLDKFNVEPGFFEMVEFEFSEIYPHMMEDVEYTPQDIISEPLWAVMDSVAQRQAIFCLKHLAQMDDVPLVDVSCPDCGASVFEIITA